MAFQDQLQIFKVIFHLIFKIFKKYWFLIFIIIFVLIATTVIPVIIFYSKIEFSPSLFVSEWIKTIFSGLIIFLIIQFILTIKTTSFVFISIQYYYDQNFIQPLEELKNIVLSSRTKDEYLRIRQMWGEFSDNVEKYKSQNYNDHSEQIAQKNFLELFDSKYKYLIDSIIYRCCTENVCDKKELNKYLNGLSKEVKNIGYKLHHL